MKTKNIERDKNIKTEIKKSDKERNLDKKIENPRLSEFAAETKRMKNLVGLF